MNEQSEELRRLREMNAELLAACKLFLAYDACGSDDGYEMMATYAAALEAIEAVVAKAEGKV